MKERQWVGENAERKSKDGRRKRKGLNEWRKKEKKKEVIRQGEKKRKKNWDRERERERK